MLPGLDMSSRHCRVDRETASRLLRQGSASYGKDKKSAAQRLKLSLQENPHPSWSKLTWMVSHQTGHTRSMHKVWKTGIIHQVDYYMYIELVSLLQLRSWLHV